MTSKSLLERSFNRLKRGINVGSQLELEQLNRVVSENLMRFKEIIYKIFPFDQASEAFGYLSAGKHAKKILSNSNGMVEIIHSRGRIVNFELRF